MENYDEEQYQAALKKVEDSIRSTVNANCGEELKEIMMSCILYGDGFKEMSVPLGEEEHNIYVVMDGIYDYARKHPEENLPDLFNRTIQSEFIGHGVCGHIEDMTKMFHYYEYILKCQREKTATFCLDVGKYLEFTKGKFFRVYCTPKEYVAEEEEYPKYKAMVEEHKTWIEERFHDIESLLKTAADTKQLSEEKKRIENDEKQRYQAAIKKVEDSIESVLNAEEGEEEKVRMLAKLMGSPVDVVMDGIYDYAKKHPEVNLPDLCNRALQYNASNKDFSIMFRYYEYILKCQIEKTATFDLDVKKSLGYTGGQAMTIVMNRKYLNPYTYESFEDRKDWISERYQYIESLLKIAADANQSSEEKKKKSWKDIIVEDIRLLLKKWKD